MAKINIGFDIDSVALKYTEKFNQVFPLFGGKTDLSNVKSFNYFNHIREDEKKALYMTFAYVMNAKLDVYPDFLNVMRFVLERNRQLRFITARQKLLSEGAARESLIAALNLLGIDERLHDHVLKIDCTGFAGEHGSKLPLAQKYEMEYFVEDRRKNVLELANAGITVFMPRKPWNEIPDNTPNVIKYNDAGEIIRHLKSVGY